MVNHLSVLSKAVPRQKLLSVLQMLMLWLSYYIVPINYVWMDLGHSSDNTKRYVHIMDLANHLGPVLCKAFPGYHDLTGCDYTTSFFKKGN